MTDLLLEYNHVCLENMGDLTDGKIKLTDTAVVFKNRKTGKVETIATADVKAAAWTRLANAPALKLRLKDESCVRFGNFSETDFDKLKSFARNVWDVELEREEMSVKGWNYGKVDFTGAMLDFTIADKTAFNVPLVNVSQATTGKNETVLGFLPNDDCAVCLTEMRFHVSPDDGDGDANPCEDMKERILQYASVVKETDAPLTTLEQVTCNPPRGRYDVKLYPNHLSFHGKSFDYRVPVKSILRLFLLPHRDGRLMYFVMGLDPPIRQGQARYHYIVLEFVKDDEIELQISLSEAELREKFGDKLDTEMSGPTYEVISRIMRALINQKITVPGNFVANGGANAVGAAYKSSAGSLYPLEKGFVFVNKPTMYIRYEEISIVHFARSDVNTRSFDFEVELNNGIHHVFNSIEKEEYSRLYDFVSKKKLRIRNAKKSAMEPARDDYAGSSDEDHYKERLKKEAAGRQAAARSAARDSDNDDDDSESDDEDFDPDVQAKKDKAEDDLPSDMSEPDDEYDSDAKTTSEEGDAASDDDADEQPKKKAKKERRASPAPRKKAGAKAVKDKNAPKRPMSAYFMWLNANRKSLTKPGMSVTDVAKAAGVAWKEVGDKTEWDALVVKDKERYAREMETYVPAETPTTSKASGGGAKKKTTSKQVSPTKGIQSREYLSTTDDSSADDGEKKKKKKKAPKEDAKMEHDGSDDESAEASDSDE